MWLIHKTNLLNLQAWQMSIMSRRHYKKPDTISPCLLLAELMAGFFLILCSSSVDGLIAEVAGFSETYKPWIASFC
jgi:hypothetical protein